MNARALIEKAACDGVEIRLGSDGVVRLRGTDLALARWLELLRKAKPFIQEEMSRRQRPTTEQEAELRLLTAAVYRDAEEAQSGFALGIVDINAALTCYRSLVALAGRQETHT